MILIDGKKAAAELREDLKKEVTELRTKYNKENYPKNNGLIISGILLRRHNDLDVIKTMESWWTELKYGSKRDQLSFNYVAWKNNLKFNYIDGDSRNNDYFIRDTKPHKGKK